MKVAVKEIVEALREFAVMPHNKINDLAQRIEAHGIEQPNDGRKPIAWEVETKAYGKGYSFSEEFFEVFPRFPCTSMLDALITEIDGLSPSHVNDEYGCKHSDTLIMYHACDIKAITDKYRGQK